MNYGEIHEAFQKKFPDLAEIEADYRPAILPCAIKVWLEDNGDDPTLQDSYVIFQMYGKHDEGKLLGYKNYYKELWDYIFSQGDLSRKSQQMIKKDFNTGNLFEEINVLERYIVWSYERDHGDYDDSKITEELLEDDLKQREKRKEQTK